MAGVAAVGGAVVAVAVDVCAFHKMTNAYVEADVKLESCQGQWKNLAHRMFVAAADDQEPSDVLDNLKSVDDTVAEERSVVEIGVAAPADQCQSNAGSPELMGLIFGVEMGCLKTEIQLEKLHVKPLVVETFRQGCSSHTLRALLWRWCTPWLWSRGPCPLCACSSLVMTVELLSFVPPDWACI